MILSPSPRYTRVHYSRVIQQKCQITPLLAAVLTPPNMDPISLTISYVADRQHHFLNAPDPQIAINRVVHISKR